MNAIEILKSKGLKKTAQRVLLIQILQKKGISLTEGDIKAEMGELYDRVTFYRTIQTLLDAQVIHRIAVNPITVKYALNNPEHPETLKNHAHFFCKQCHSITCLGNTAEVNYPLPQHFTQEEYEVLIKGICDKCNAQNAK